MQIAGRLLTEHAGWALILPGLLCLISSYAALGLAQHARTVDRGGRLGWVLMAAGACAAGVWGLHFSAMLGYAPRLAPGLPFSFELVPAIGSLGVIAVAAFMPMLACASSGRRSLHAMAGAFLGLGIAAMHYTAMAGFRAPGHILWNHGMVALSIGVGVGLASLALTIFARSRVVAPAAVLTLATAGLHYTAMAAVTIVPTSGDAGGGDATVRATDGGHLHLELGIVAVVALALGFAGLVLFARHLRQMTMQIGTRDEALRLRNEQFDTALNNMTQGLAMYDGDNRLIVSNRRYLELTGVPEEVMRPGVSFRDVLMANKAVGNFPGVEVEEIWQERLRLVELDASATVMQQLANGRIVSLHFEPMPSGGWLATYTDITAQKRAEAQIYHMAHHDPMTGLPNRTKFVQAMQASLLTCGPMRKLGLLYLDLDGFKEINDTLGHQVGDRLLKAVARRLGASVRNSDCVARLGGDEFAVIQERAIRRDSPAVLADRLIETLSAKYEIDGHSIRIGVSIGSAMAPVDADTPDELLKKADVALYRAKAAGGLRHRPFQAPAPQGESHAPGAMAKTG